MRKWLASLGYHGTVWGFWWPPLVQLVIIIAASAGIATLLADAQWWEGWNLSRVADGEYCERLYFERLVRQPSNSWSNFFYLFYGLLCIRFAIHDKQHGPSASSISGMPLVSWVYGFAFAYLCFGSFLFHASLTRTGQHWDMAATYGLMAVPIAFMLWKLFLPHLQGRSAAFFVTGLVVIMDILFYVFKWHLNGLFTLGSLILTLVLFMAIHKFMGKSKINYWYGAAGIFFTLLAYFIWMQDRDKIWCNPNSIVQGHAIWHALTGLGAFCAYLMFRSEQVRLDKEI